MAGLAVNCHGKVGLVTILKSSLNSHTNSITCTTIIYMYACLNENLLLACSIYLDWLYIYIYIDNFCDGLCVSKDPPKIVGLYFWDWKYTLRRIQIKANSWSIWLVIYIDNFHYGLASCF